MNYLTIKDISNYVEICPESALQTIKSNKIPIIKRFGIQLVLVSDVIKKWGPRPHEAKGFDPDEYVSLKEAAEFLETTVNYMRNLLRSGRFEFIEKGNRYLIPKRVLKKPKLCACGRRICKDYGDGLCSVCRGKKKHKDSRKNKA